MKLPEFCAALAFFSRLPVGIGAQNMSIQGLTAYLPAVGLVIGLLVGVFFALFSILFPASLAGLLTALTWVMLTGGLHLDGLADCADGLCVEAQKEKRLTIMKDPTVGTFACIAVFFILSLKVFALSYLAEIFSNIYSEQKNFLGFLFMVLYLCFCASLARSMVFVAHTMPSAHTQGYEHSLGKLVTKGVTNTTKIKNALFVLALGVCTCSLGLYLPEPYIFGYKIPLALLSALALSFYIMRMAKRKIGGITGDVYGCIIEVSECAILLSLCIQV